MEEQKLSLFDGYLFMHTFCSKSARGSGANLASNERDCGLNWG
jgi:hypothetical protein